MNGALAGRLYAIARAPLYVWLLAIYPIALIAVLNRGQVAGSKVLLALACGAAAATICVFAYRPLAGSWPKAALCAAVTVVLFYAFGPIGMVIDAWWIERSDHGDTVSAVGIAAHAPLLLSALWLLGLTAAVLAVRRAREPLIARLAAPLNLVTGMLVATVAAQSITSLSTSTTHRPADATPVALAAPYDNELPDIYYIILDGYARADVLAQYYAHDNSPFLDALRGRGFTINERGYANYYWTQLSLASSLNMDYLPAVLGDQLDPDSNDQQIIYEQIRNGAVTKALRAHGYRFLQLQSTWGATLANPHADALLPCGTSLFADEFFRALAEASWLRALNAHASAKLAECHHSNFASLAAVATESGPKFVLAHFLLPHHPYVFDRHGNVLHDATIANQFDYQARLWERRDRYLEQLLHVNDAVLAAISRILETSARPPIIVLQSDHGPHLRVGLTQTERRRVRLANLAAFHLPGAPPDLIPQGDSPVNSFRRILSFYTGAELPPLPNRHFYSPFERPFAVKEVTALVASDPLIVSEAPR